MRLLLVLPVAVLACLPTDPLSPSEDFHEAESNGGPTSTTFVVAIETTLPWELAKDDPKNALVPIVVQMNSSPEAGLLGDPTLVKAEPNGKESRLICRIRLGGDRAVAEANLAKALSPNDYIKAFRIVSVE